MEEDVKSIGDYLDILVRRKYWIIFPAIILMLITVVVVLKMPATYKSHGLILIESQEIPQELIRTTVTSYADQRIEVIKQRLLTSRRIMQIAEKHDLYPAVRRSTPSTTPIVTMFTANLGVNMVQANVTDTSGRRQMASIAFEVSFMDESPIKAQQVANDLITEFLSENVRQRTERASETSGFLRLEADRMQKEVQRIETEIAEFRDKNSDSLPDLLDFNLNMLQATQEEIANIENQIKSTTDQISTMGIQLSLIPKDISRAEIAQPNQISTPERELEQLKSEYRSMQSRYSANHPDLQRTKRLIDSLEAELGVFSTPREDLQQQLTIAKSNLQNLSQRYSSEHPDVKAAESELSRIERLMAELPNESVASSQSPSQARGTNNPIYIEVSAKIDAAQREISRMRQRQQELRVRLGEYEQRIYKTNQVQRAYLDLTRDHENKLNQYNDLRAKQLEAELAQTLETESKGESFVLIEPPVVPDTPEKPDRPKLIAMGFIASVGAGVGIAILMEMLFGGVRGYTQISKIVGKAPLVVIPVISTEYDKARKRLVRNLMIVLFIIIVFVALAIVHYFIMNLEVLWFKIMNRFNLL